MAGLSEAVQQEHWLALAGRQVVQANAIHVGESALHGRGTCAARRRSLREALVMLYRMPVRPDTASRVRGTF
jgi:hypothetical protein